MPVYFEDDETLLGSNRIREFARLQGECLVLKLLRQFSALENAQGPALGSSGAVRVLFGQIIKLCSLAELLHQAFGLGLSLGNACGIFGKRCFSGSFRRVLTLGVRGRGPYRNQN